MEKTVLETVAEVAEDWRLDDVKGLLGRYNFKADMLDRKVSFLSGGEKVRCLFTLLSNNMVAMCLNALFCYFRRYKIGIHEF